MKIRDESGPAFPVSNGYEYKTGMSLRDWFAGMALQGYLTDTKHPDSATPSIVAEWCYANADAMLEARQK